MGAGSTFTQADIDSGKLTYVHNGDEPDSLTGGKYNDSFKFRVSDGAETSAEGSFWINVKPLNDAPTIEVAANEFVENSAKAGDVAATYKTQDEDNTAGELTVSFTGDSNKDGYYELKNGQVVLTDTSYSLRQRLCMAQEGGQ